MSQEGGDNKFEVQKQNNDLLFSWFDKSWNRLTNQPFDTLEEAKDFMDSESKKLITGTSVVSEESVESERQPEIGI